MSDELQVNTERPNLFHYATSELSQDAFICWLAAWADPKWKNSVDSELHQMAMQFLMSLIRKTENTFEESRISTVDVKHQADRIDVLIEINKDRDDKLAILIEDKTHTDHHSDQLKRYFDIVKLKRSYVPNQIIPIFFKTGYQSRFGNLGDFKAYLREDFLKLLRAGKETVKHAIYHEFLTHMESMESAVTQFSKKEPIRWSDNDWRGFFMKLYPHLETYGANWGHVNNKSGGFIGFWWDDVSIPGVDYKPYLQLETPYLDLIQGYAKAPSLCFKIAVVDRLNANTAWHEASEKLLKTSLQAGIPLLSSKRSVGHSMTVARWKDEYRVFNNGTLDMEATLENLKKAQAVLDLAFPS